MGRARAYIKSIIVLPDVRDEIYPYTENLIKLLKETGVNVRTTISIVTIVFYEKKSFQQSAHEMDFLSVISV